MLTSSIGAVAKVKTDVLVEMKKERSEEVAIPTEPEQIPFVPSHLRETTKGATEPGPLTQSKKKKKLLVGDSKIEIKVDDVVEVAATSKKERPKKRAHSASRNPEDNPGKQHSLVDSTTS